MRYIGIIGGVVAALAFAATATAGSFEDKAQVTVSGGEYMLNGYIVKIEGDAYWIRKASGDVVRVAVTEGTHLICPTRAGNKEGKVESKPGAGFRMGDCLSWPGFRGHQVKPHRAGARTPAGSDSQDSDEAVGDYRTLR